MKELISFNSIHRWVIVDCTRIPERVCQLLPLTRGVSERVGLLCSASRTSTGWAQRDGVGGSGRERGGYFSGPEGLYAVTWTCGGSFLSTDPVAVQTTWMKRSVCFRLVEIQGEMRRWGVLALQPEARVRRRRLICPVPPPPRATACIQPLLWTVRSQFPAVWTVIHADVAPLLPPQLTNACWSPKPH